LRDTELGRVYGRWETKEVKGIDEVKENDVGKESESLT
jgi:hypothetical protein